MASQKRFFCIGRSLYNKTPRFLNTLKEASKPPLTKPEVISRPFGFDERVTLQNTAPSIFNLFSKEGKEQRKRQLDHDIAHSPFYESKSFANTKGKIFSPPISYFKQDRAKYFPSFLATPLLGKAQELYDMLANKVSIIRIFSTLSGETCTKTYVGDYLDREGYEELQAKFPNSQIIDLCIPQSKVKSLFVSLGSLSVRRTIPESRLDKYFIIPHGYFDVDTRQILKCDNTCSGYLYVVDEQGKIRWATSGNATESEMEIFFKCLRGLQKELTKKEQEA